MSKSKGNYIGIAEPPKVIFRKIMQVSDQLMYRCYELLTDLQMSEIEQLSHDVAAGRRDPMEVKMDLGSRVVADFHSAAEADEARTAFDREIRQGLEPADIETVALPEQACTDKAFALTKCSPGSDFLRA